ncbi:MAG TPA: sugar phosphate nucleotidyltransferase [Pirellulaceae bacterium]|nr:sugar phosphate nucleotidyltransferase [Pirellulaceae bacterium]
MRVRKAVITAAGLDHLLPLQRLVDRQGVEKTALQLILEEVATAGVEEVAVIIRPGDTEAFRNAVGANSSHLRFIEQTQPRGYGDALLRARDFTAGEHFLHLVGDHLYLSSTQTSCARQLVALAEVEACSVSAVQATRENKLPFFGAIGGRRVARQHHLYDVTHVLEKPTPTEAEQKLLVAGLRSGYYLCMFGMHVLSPLVMNLLAETAANPDVKAAPLASALATLAERERYLAFEIDGARYNIGVKYGLLMAQLALSLSGNDRDVILTDLLQLLIERPGQGGAS